MILRHSLIEDVIRKIGETTSLDELSSLLADLRDPLQLAHIVYCGVNIDASSPSNSIPLLTYDPIWVARYLEREYFRIDPLIGWGRTAYLPLPWSDVKHSSESRRFFNEATRYDVGRQGLTIPIGSAGLRPAIFTITSNCSDEQWKPDCERYMFEFQSVAQSLHLQAIRLSGCRGHDHETRLSPQEKKSLQLIAHGLTSKQIAAQLNITPAAVDLYLRNARQKLNCSTIPQLVARALTLGIIEP